MTQAETYIGMPVIVLGRGTKLFIIENHNTEYAGVSGRKDAKTCYALNYDKLQSREKAYKKEQDGKE